jgi:hypothetical protein
MASGGIIDSSTQPGVVSNYRLNPASNTNIRIESDDRKKGFRSKQNSIFTFKSQTFKGAVNSETNEAACGPDPGSKESEKLRPTPLVKHPKKSRHS